MKHERKIVCVILVIILIVCVYKGPLRGPFIILRTFQTYFVHALDSSIEYLLFRRPKTGLLFAFNTATTAWAVICITG